MQYLRPEFSKSEIPKLFAKCKSVRRKKIAADKLVDAPGKIWSKTLGAQNKNLL